MCLLTTHRQFTEATEPGVDLDYLAGEDYRNRGGATQTPPRRALPPTPLIDSILGLRIQTDLHPVSLDQAIHGDFIVDRYLGRHLRCMRSLNATRLAALIDRCRQYLRGLREISALRAGSTTRARGFLQNEMIWQEEETAAPAHGVNPRALDRFGLKQQD